MRVARVTIRASLSFWGSLIVLRLPGALHHPRVAAAPACRDAVPGTRSPRHPPAKLLCCAPQSPSHHAREAGAAAQGRFHRGGRVIRDPASGSIEGGCDMRAPQRSVAIVVLLVGSLLATALATSATHGG